jgi:hypothetical protein
MATTTQTAPKTDTTNRQEGPVAKAIEAKTSRLPSDLFLWTAGGAIVASLTLQAMHQKERSNFVGQWVPTILLLGLYNKMVKQHGSEGTH